MADGVPGIPMISLDGTELRWRKPEENGEPIEGYILRYESRYTFTIVFQFV